MKNFLVVLVAGAMVLLVVFAYGKKYAGTTHYAVNYTARGSSLPKDPLKKSVHMAINPSIELDFKSKAEIYKIREKYVNQYSELVPKSYKPSEIVFGQIIDGKPWWGETGSSYYGRGVKSIEGMSEETRYLANPYLLVGVDTLYGFTCGKRRSRSVLSFPLALEMIWESRTIAHAYFDVSSFRNRAIRCNFHPSQVTKLNLVAYNARDFGYNYLGVDLAQSENIQNFGASQIPAHIKQFIHLGGNCEYPGGCNNASPHQPELHIPYAKLPAKAHIKLWKKEPNSINDTADFTFIIYMM